MSHQTNASSCGDNRNSRATKHRAPNNLWIDIAIFRWLLFSAKFVSEFKNTVTPSLDFDCCCKSLILCKVKAPVSCLHCYICVPFLSINAKSSSQKSEIILRR